MTSLERYSKLKSLAARVFFKSPEKGGHPRAFSGIRPSFEIKDQLIACKILKGEIGSPLELGVWHKVVVELPYGEIFENQLKSGFRFRLMVASWEIGHGEIE